ncbi:MULTISPECIES: hypothetical protein [Prauserella]|uniref:ArsR family transcriptional regulator n=1 Tax=Prauserella endophytica TaxID=1592324 RepID=A0ABY2RYD5_9PSEU|nr:MULTISPECIES: hypothetical protein [Prauserella]TKG65248.1 hypothetical protein FCN18_27465 [Prauserella endophytica]
MLAVEGMRRTPRDRHRPRPAARCPSTRRAKAAAGNGRRGAGAPSRCSGERRAGRLRALTTPLSASAPAVRLGTSAGAASKRVAALGESGLADSTRHGGAVVHHVTAPGEALLSGEAG